ncbi:lipocalin-like domain-containing protein [Vibrio rumoiensis]|uniref:ABC transporter n=1 Tax=Vibrio rumoiensis 1S-45 TaxID=1188252 RepID=A0A1E5DZN9_9VIBR|nr:lipocalin-like domain-containing protein [Vibrio rumoiensis]OEF23508.1 ABC transporter [Vibrio rumoiensis 1S-45]
MISPTKQWTLKFLLFGIVIVMIIGVSMPYWAKRIVAQELGIKSIETVKNSDKQAIYEPVLPDTAIKVGKDFNEHPSFHNETWHYKANLKGEDGKEYGVQWTMYRIANGDHLGVGWKNSQIYTAQVAISTPDQSWSDQRISRGGIGQAGVLMNPFRMWIDDWIWQSSNNFSMPSRLHVKTDDFAINLTSAAYGPFVLNGDKGYKKTHDLLTTASYSYSAPFLKAKGSLILNGKEVAVHGQAWLDKEWGNHLISDSTLRWDAFSIHLADGRSLALTHYHNPQDIRYISGTLAGKDGSVINIDSDDVRLYPLETHQLANGRLLLLRWVIEIPKYKISLITQSTNQEMWLPFWIPSWEGPIKVTGSQTGVGFMQLTGY